MTNKRIYGTQKKMNMNSALNMIKKRKLYEKCRTVSNLIHLQWQRNLAK